MKKKAHDKETLIERGAWVPKILLLMPLIEREKRRERIAEKILYYESRE